MEKCNTKTVLGVEVEKIILGNDLADLHSLYLCFQANSTKPLREWVWELKRIVAYDWCGDTRPDTDLWVSTPPDGTERAVIRWAIDYGISTEELSWNRGVVQMFPDRMYDIERHLPSGRDLIWQCERAVRLVLNLSDSEA